MYKVSKEFNIACAHRLYGYEGDCKNLHGHNYKIIVTYNIIELDKDGIAIDFKEIKNKVGKWLDDLWDHATLVNSEDDELLEFLKTQKMRFYTFFGNPTAEKMCHELLIYFSSMYSVKIYETETSYVEVYQDDLRS